MVYWQLFGCTCHGPPLHLASSGGGRVSLLTMLSALSAKLHPKPCGKTEGITPTSTSSGVCWSSWRLVLTLNRLQNASCLA